MKRMISRRWVWLLLAVLLVAGGLAIGGPVRAYLGNSGIPVRCVRTAPLQPGFRSFMACVPAGTPAFTDSDQRVPPGYYFLVTDITIIPDGGADTQGVTDVYIHNAFGDSDRVTSARLRGVTTASYGISYRVPYLVLPAGHRLELVNDAASQMGISVRISGLLVTNLNFVPLVASGD